jgi:hypothetical protein
LISGYTLADNEERIAADAMRPSTRSYTVRLPSSQPATDTLRFDLNQFSGLPGGQHLSADAAYGTRHEPRPLDDPLSLKSYNLDPSSLYGFQSW